MLKKIKMLRKIGWFWPVLFFMIGMWILPISIMGNRLEYIPGDLGDARLNLYFLEHGYRWIIGKTDSFWNAPFFYPASNVMAYSDNHLGTLPFYAFFRAMTLSRETAFQAWILLLFSLNFLSSYLVLRKFTISKFGSGAGAFIFSFSLPVAVQLCHIQLLPRFMMPVGFYFTWQYLRRGNFFIFIGLLASLLWQFYCSIYLGLFLVYLLAALIAAYIITAKKSFSWANLLDWNSRKALILKLSSVFAFTLLIAPLFLPYIEFTHEQGLRNWSEISRMLPRWQSYFLPPPGTFLWKFLLPIGHNLRMQVEHTIYVGAVPWIAFFFCTVICFRRNSQMSFIAKTSIICFLILFMMTLYINGISIYQIITLLPGVAAIRAVGRNIFGMLFLFSIMVALQLYLIEKKLEKRSYILKLGILILIAAIVTLDQLTVDYYRINKIEMQKRVSTLVNIIKSQKVASNVFVYMPDKKEEPFKIHLDSMLAAQDLNMATVNGYSGHFPTNYPLYADYNSEKKLQKWITYSKTQYNGNNTSVYLKESNDSIFKDLIVVRKEPKYIQPTVKYFAQHAIPFEKRKIQLFSGEYVSITDEGFLRATHESKPSRVANTSFLVFHFDVDKVAFRAQNGKYVCAEGGGGDILVANRDKVGEWEIFTSVDLKNGKIALKTFNENYITTKDGYLTATANSVEESSMFKLISIENE